MNVFEKYNLGQKKVLFIATFHNNNSESFFEIEKSLSDFSPEIILIEGGYENSSFVNRNCAMEEGEMGLVSYYSRMNGIVLKANDPPESKSVNYISEIFGKDLAFLYFVLRDFGLSRIDSNDLLGREREIARILDEFKELSGWKDYDYSEDKYKVLFRKVFLEDFDLRKDYKNYFTGKVSEVLNIYRDNYMMGQLLKYLAQFNRIAIVKGYSHLEDNRYLFRRLFDGE